jgi:hypothetical protein
MAAELLVVAACSHHAIGQQPVAFPRIPPGLNLGPISIVWVQSPADTAEVRTQTFEMARCPRVSFE